MAQMILYVFGAVFVIIGLLGFFDNPLVGAEGYFATNMAHDLVHLVTGLIMLWLGKAGAGAARTGAQVFGVVYAIVAILGLVMSGEMLLGFLQVNMADNILHVVIALVLLYAGFAGGGTQQAGPAGAMGGEQRMQDEERRPEGM